MATIATPEFPVITWQVEIPIDYEIGVTINSVTKRVIVNANNFTGLVNFSINPVTGNYLLYGYDLPGLITFSDSVATLIKYAVEAVIRQPAAVQPGFLPDGGFNLNTGFQGITTYEYQRVLGVPSGTNTILGVRLRLQIDTTGFPGTTTIDFGDLRTSVFGATSPTSFSFPSGSATAASKSIINSGGYWTPDNKTVYEDRNITASAYTSVSTFNSNTYRTINWSNEKEQLALQIPYVYATQIWAYRRADERFNTGNLFREDDPNNLYQQLISAARVGRKFRIFWNYDSDDDSYDVEEFFISDPDTLGSVDNSLEDVSDNRGKLFSVTIPFTKYEE